MLCDLYLRLSDGRTENGTFADREKALRARASVLGWAVRRVVIENDLMNGSKSASAFKRRKVGVDANGKAIMRVWRPGFRSVLNDLSAGSVQAILAEDLDRTMRDPRDAEDLIDVLKERGAFADSLSGSLRFTAGGHSPAGRRGPGADRRCCPVGRRTPALRLHPGTEPVQQPPEHAADHR